MLSIFKQGLSLPHLPAELTDMIIDYLQSDPTTLCATCLVCRSWLPRSRVHLFRQLSISVPRRKRFDALVGFLENSPHISQRVKELELYGPELLSDEQSSRTTEELPPAIPAAALATLLALLPYLSQLHLFDVSFRSYNLCELKLHALPRYKLDLLAMHGVGSPHDTIDDAMCVLDLFSEIGFLHLGSTEQRLAVRTRLPRGLKVSSLHVEDVPCDMYLDAMRELELGGRLEFLESQASCLEDVRSLANLVENTTSKLWHLGISLTELFANPYIDDDHEPGPLRTDPEEVSAILAPKLALCKNLDWFSVSIPFTANGGASEGSYTIDAWRFLIDLIPAIPSSVPWVTVYFVPYDGSPIEDAGYNWTELSIAAEPFLRQKDAFLDLKYSPLNGPGKDLDLAELCLLTARK